MENYLLDNVKEKGIVNMIMNYSKETIEERQHLINMCEMKLSKIMADNFYYHLSMYNLDYMNPDIHTKLFLLIKRFSRFFNLINNDIKLYNDTLQTPFYTINMNCFIYPDFNDISYLFCSNHINIYPSCSFISSSGTAPSTNIFY